MDKEETIIERIERIEKRLDDIEFNAQFNNNIPACNHEWEYYQGSTSGAKRCRKCGIIQGSYYSTSGTA